MGKVLFIRDGPLPEETSWTEAIRSSGLSVEAVASTAGAPEGPSGWCTLLAPLSSPRDMDGPFLQGAAGLHPNRVLVVTRPDPAIWRKAARQGLGLLVDSRVGAAGIARTLRAALALQAELNLRLLPLESCCLGLGAAPADPSSRLIESLGRIFHSQGCVTILAEEGTGGELLAAMIHFCRGRSGPFLGLDCAAIPGAIIHPLLLGSAEWGPGYLEIAAGGSLLLRNAHELPNTTQAALLHCILNKEYTRPGTEHRVVLDMDLITAVASPLAAAVEEGRFSRGLAVALEETVVTLPPLRERNDEIPSFAAFWAAHRDHRCTLTPEFLQALAENAFGFFRGIGS